MSVPQINEFESVFFSFFLKTDEILFSRGEEKDAIDYIEDDNPTEVSDGWDDPEGELFVSADMVEARDLLEAEVFT